MKAKKIGTTLVARLRTKAATAPATRAVTTMAMTGPGTMAATAPSTTAVATLRAMAAAALGLLLLAGVAGAQAPKKMGPAEATLQNWNDIGNRLITMAEDFPAEKYTFRATPEVRTFQQVLLHVAASNYSLINVARGKKLGIDQNDPPIENFKTKAEVVAFLKKSVADGADTIHQMGNAGMLEHLVDWMGMVEHSGEHYGQLVVYYRLNGIVPPESRPKK
jgi:uncharacterized damage-inducible protein DinB